MVENNVCQLRGVKKFGAGFDFYKIKKLSKIIFYAKCPVKMPLVET